MKRHYECHDDPKTLQMRWVNSIVNFYLVAYKSFPPRFQPWPPNKRKNFLAISIGFIDKRWWIRCRASHDWKERKVRVKLFIATDFRLGNLLMTSKLWAGCDYWKNFLNPVCVPASTENLFVSFISASKIRIYPRALNFTQGWLNIFYKRSPMMTLTPRENLCKALRIFFFRKLKLHFKGFKGKCVNRYAIETFFVVKFFYSQILS